MGALVLLSMMAMPLADVQYAPNRVAASSGPVSSGASVFRSVLDPQLEFGPTDLQQVRIAHAYFPDHALIKHGMERSLSCPLQIALSPGSTSNHAHMKHGIERSVGCPLQIALSP